MWHVLFIGILRNIQFPLTMVKGKQCMLCNVLADDIFVLRNVATIRSNGRFHNQRKHRLRFNGHLRVLMGYL